MRLPLLPDHLSPGTALMVRAVDKIVVDKQVSTSALAETDKHEVWLLLGTAYADGSDDVRRFMLEHEAGHLAGDAFRRGQALIGSRPEKDDVAGMLEWQERAGVWNIAHDAAIHHMPFFRWMMEQPELAPLTKKGLATFDSLHLPVSTAEVAYETLMSRRQKHGASCGSLVYSMSKGKGRSRGFGPATRVLAKAVAAAMGRLAGSNAGNGRTLEGEAETPAWAKPLLKELRHATGNDWEHERTYRRPHRYIDGLPVRTRVRSGKGLLLVDVSASMSDEMLQVIRQAVTRVLRGCDLVLWDTVATPRRRALAFDRGLAQVGGGGTDPSCAADRRQPGEVNIWVTDGYVNAWPEMTSRDIVVLVAEGGLQPPVSARVVHAGN